MTKSSLEALKKKAVARVPKLAKTLHAGCVAMDIQWCEKVPTEGDIIQILTCLINDLDPLGRKCVRSETGRLYASYEEHDSVAEIDFGLDVNDYVMKAV